MTVRTLLPLALTFAMSLVIGCVCVSDLDTMQRKYPMRQNFELATGLEKSVDALPRRCIVGKWEAKFNTWEGLWRSNGSHETCQHSYRRTYDIRDDGTCTIVTWKDGDLVSTVESPWRYSVKSRGVGTIVFSGLKLAARSVFWYGENKMVLSYVNNDSAIRWWTGSFINLYGSKWQYRINYRRDSNLNVEVTSSHISPESTHGDRRVNIEQAEIYRRIGDPRTPDADRPALQAPAKKNGSKKKKAYDILSLERSIEGAFAYRFELELADGEETTLKVLKSVKQDFRKAIRDDYAESFTGSSVASLFVEFPQFMLRDGRIVGKAVVMSMVVMSMKYDPLTRTGRMAVCLSGGQFEETRKWIRRNIEALARDKNSALTTGKLPPAAKFYLGREELKDGNMLEIESKTE